MVSRTIAAVTAVIVLIIGLGGGFIAGQTSESPTTVTHVSTITQTMTTTKIQNTGALASNTIHTSVGDNFYITLDSNPSTGYWWQVANMSNPSALQLLGTEYQGPGGTPMPGAGGKQILSFKALQQGNITVTLEYVRPWENGQPPASYYSFNVIVQS